MLSASSELNHPHPGSASLRNHVGGSAPAGEGDDGIRLPLKHSGVALRPGSLPVRSPLGMANVTFDARRLGPSPRHSINTRRTALHQFGDRCLGVKVPEHVVDIGHVAEITPAANYDPHGGDCTK